MGEYAAVALLMFFGLKSIKDAWDLPSAAVKDGEENTGSLDEYTEAEELVKEKVRSLRSNLQASFSIGLIDWKMFLFLFFALMFLVTINARINDTL